MKVSEAARFDWQLQPKTFGRNITSQSGIPMQLNMPAFKNQITLFNICLVELINKSLPRTITSMKLAYEEEVSRINNNPEFEYPLKLRMGMRFSDFNELKYAIQNEALQRGLPINLYGRHYHPSIEKWHLFAFYCKVCGARLNFYNVSGDYVAGTLNVHHVHGEMQLARFRQRRV